MIFLMILYILLDVIDRLKLKIQAIWLLGDNWGTTGGLLGEYWVTTVVACDSLNHSNYHIIYQSLPCICPMFKAPSENLVETWDDLNTVMILIRLFNYDPGPVKITAWSYNEYSSCIHWQGLLCFHDSFWMVKDHVEEEMNFTSL